MIALLLDQNLSPRLVERLRDVAGVEHVDRVGLGMASDEEVWAYARANALTIVTKDADFEDLAVLRGAPPRIVWLRLGNCTTSEAEEAIRVNLEAIERFVTGDAGAVLVIRGRP